MTPNEYKHWKARRGEPGTWNLAICRAADKLVKAETMKKFTEWAKANIGDKVVRDWMVAVVNAHFGSADVDDMLTHLSMYPDWM